MGYLYKKSSRIQIGFTFLKIGLIVIITAHLIMPGWINVPYIDLTGYLFLVTGLVAIRILSKKVTYCIFFNFSSFLLSSIAYILLSKNASISYDEVTTKVMFLDIMLSSVITIFDLLTMFIICNIFYCIGVEYNSSEVCKKISSLKKSLIGLVFLFIINNYNAILHFLSSFAMLINGVVKLFLIMCVVYVYMNLTGLFHITRKLLYIYTDKN